MKGIRKIRNRVGIGTILHALTLLFFISTLSFLTSFLPYSTNAGELESWIQLLTQVLAVVVGVLLLGITVYFSSYDISDTLNSIHGNVELTSNRLFERFFSGGRRRHKIDRPRFREFLFRKTGISEFIFYEKRKDELESHFVYRPYWDGVWYQAFDSPFRTPGRNDEQVFRIQVAHEVVLCAYKVLAAVSKLRHSDAALLSKNSGTQGTRWFLEALEKSETIDNDTLPLKLNLAVSLEMVGLAIYSTHYMWEELREHAEELDWEPYRLSRFHLAFIDYLLWLNYMVAKFQALRLANIEVRFPGMRSRMGEKIETILALDIFGRVKQEAFQIRKKVVTTHGVARYSMDMKRISIPGITLAIVALLSILIAWPFVKSSPMSSRLVGFAVLYSIGIAALVESSFFLARILWNKVSRKGDSISL